MPSILFLDVEDHDIALVRDHFPAAAFAKDLSNEDEVIDVCKGYEIISTFETAFPASVIENLPDLKLIATRSVGYDHIDLDACKERGVTVCNVPDYGSHVIAEHVFALLLSTVRHIAEGEKRVESGTFDYRGLRGMALKDKTIGILGTGRIGGHVAHIAHGFDMKILATDRCRVIELEQELGVRYVPFEELLTESDILTLHVPATDDTHHLLNDKAFMRMKDGVILINTARGSIIDSKALLKALESGKVRYALLDVLEHEHNFEENKALIKHPRVVTTPHIAFYADESMKNMYVDSFQSIDEFLSGKEPQHIIHPLSVVCDLPGAKAS
ncbi:MAG TPA: NAD(P)-dependent oxidoreductase [Candidatus Peribacteraceae bacterium]|nr:NAD(P)-dependent oxidoreductase [Candidatus Peribacteraceae bacterium]